jgi:hypothetical protein
MVAFSSRLVCGSKRRKLKVALAVRMGVVSIDSKRNNVEMAVASLRV